jgi:hypothetical protein
VAIDPANHDNILELLEYWEPKAMGWSAVPRDLPRIFPEFSHPLATYSHRFRKASRFVGRFSKEVFIDYRWPSALLYLPTPCSSFSAVCATGLPQFR